MTRTKLAGRMTRANTRAVLVLAGAVVPIVCGALVACSEAPTAVNARTFERASRMDVVCLQIYQDSVNLQPFPDGPHPRPQEECAPVASGVNGGVLANQLFALVTQTARGELAVVDLSSGIIQDQRFAIPGINFIPVGGLPTDVAVTPDGFMAFVGAAETNKQAIYGVPTYRALGDYPGFNTSPIVLPDLPVCALPQNPSSLSVVPHKQGAPGADAVDYDLVAVLPGDRLSPGKIVVIDPRPFLRAIWVADPKDGGSAEAGADSPARTYERDILELSDGPVLPRGAKGLQQLPDCPITAAIELTGGDSVPKTFRPGQVWDQGIPYADGGVDLTCDTPTPSAACGPPPCCPGVDADAGCTPLGEKDAGDIAITHGPLDPPRLMHAVRDDQFLYVADGSLPFVHVVDLSDPTQPKELPPFVATSLQDPSRSVVIRDIAVSPPTRDVDPKTGRNRRFLYAIDRDDGSLVVYDVTDPANASRTPMRRPHPELNPFQAEDRITFSSPALSVSFARHDFPLSFHGTVPGAESGLLCNPNQKVPPNPAIGYAGQLGGDPTDPNVQAKPDDPAHPVKGFYYRNDRTEPDVPLGPRRLRGVFAFATLANGEVVAIDVDDWDTPCRRPQNLSSAPNPEAETPDGGAVLPVPGALALPEPPPAGDTDVDPYHAPTTDLGSTSEEATFPIITPHNLRSDSFIKTNSATGNHVAYLNGRPTINSNGAPFPIQGTGSEATPLMLPANVGRPANTTTTMTSVPIGLQISHEDPHVHVDQDWTLTYEGVIPGFDGISATIDTTDNYGSLVLTQPNGRFCSKGVEDQAQAADRASAINAELVKAKLNGIDHLDRKLVDYIQLTEDLLPNTDAYWSLSGEPGACWEGINAPGPGPGRFDYCNAIFGAASDQNAARDFPIVEAYDDKLVISTFSSDTDLSRNVDDKNPVINAVALKQLRCCFHQQIKFHVRTGGTWSLVGNLVGQSNPGVGFLSHLTAGDGGRCVPSCDPREALLNGRTISVPSDFPGPPGRNSPLALRNPFFSFWVTRGSKAVDANGKRLGPVPRDTVYGGIQTRGQPLPLLINLASSTVAVDVQSMRFIESLGQIAVVDAQSNGLVLIDLGGVAVAHAPYF